MPVMPNLRSSAPNPLQEIAPPTPYTYVDTPEMNYVKWLGTQGAPIASIPNAGKVRVAVIGSGGGGLAAALELLRCGVDVSIFEATDRIGGRLFTSPSGSGDGNLFEMGAMRFTPSERVLHNYCDQFNASGASQIDFSTDPFPDPGGEDITYIVFQGQTYHYTPDGGTDDFPPSYAKVQNGWKAFTRDGFKSADGSISVLGTDVLTGMLALSFTGGPPVQEAWQAYIDAFGNSSLYEGMVRIFTDPNAPGGAVWDPIDFEFFGALGTGFGGFGPLFPIGFLDILRFVINAVDSDQHELLTGVESIVQGFLNQPVPFEGSTATLEPRVRINTPITGLAVQGNSVELSFAGGAVETFDRVVVATSHRSMELTMGLGYSNGGGPLSETVADAVRRLHLENSSKVFVESGAFWDQSRPGSNYNWPRNVVGDTILRNLYALTYPGAPAQTGALLFSYTWAEDSVKQQCYSDPQARLGLLFTDLATIDQELADKVQGSVIAATAQVIDWQLEFYYFGAFKLNLPGQEPYVQSLFYDFQKARDVGPGEIPPDCLVYLAGDSIGFLGGWVENALETGVNAAAGVAVSLGGTLTNPKAGPFEQLDRNTYNYGTAASAVALGR
jgi:tryptophan 2-monooxygenase